jgi:putative peptidoglycan binding protein/Gp5-like OB domain-containing protein
VLNDRATTIGNSLSTSVTQDEAFTVGGNQTTKVTGGRSDTMGGKVDFSAGDELTEAIAQNRTETTGGDHSSTIQGSRTDTITSSSTVTVGGDASESISGDFTRHVDGTATTIVGLEEATSGYSNFYVYGDHSWSASGNIRIDALQSIVMTCGASVLSMTPAGIKVVAKAVAMAAADRMYVASNGPAITLTDQAEVASKTVDILSSGASLVLDSDATLEGTTVNIGTGAPAAATAGGVNASLATKSYHVVASDPSKKPYANKNYSLLVDGNVTQGTTGSDGSIQATISAASVLAHLTVWPDDYPEGARLRWDLSLVDKLEAVDSVHGALDRLTNLGYYQGEVGDVLTDDAVIAIQRFQGDNGLPTTGALDSATTAQLSQAHGH